MQFSLLSAKNSILAVLSWGDFLSLSFPSALLFPFFPNRKMAGCNFSLLAFSPSPPLFPYQTRQEEEGRGVSPRHEITIFLPHLSLVERTTGVFQKKKKCEKYSSAGNPTRHFPRLVGAYRTHFKHDNLSDASWQLHLFVSRTQRQSKWEHKPSF